MNENLMWVHLIHYLFHEKNHINFTALHSDRHTHIHTHIQTQKKS